MNYKVPQKDIKFVLNDVLEMPAHFERFTEGRLAEPDLVDAIIEEASKFCENELVPLNQSGDEQGCTLKDGQVTLPAGFKEAYRKYIDNGWGALSGDAEFCGQGLPQSLRFVLNEMLTSANHGWHMTTGLSPGAISTIEEHADETMKQNYLPSLISGEWTGTMALTEAHCGSDLGLLRTAAVPDETSAKDNVYKISGSKMFISAGDHDLTENIIHIVLARLPDAPSGVKGISLFIVPKFIVNDDGSLGERNGVSCGSIEEKMGIHSSPTCVMNFDGATGYLIGEPNRGMSAMFTFINESRLSVAMHGPAHAEVSFQKALAYAKDREQFRATERVNKERAADPIIHHADVRRMLLTQKVVAEGGRMVNLFCSKQVDISLSDEFSDEEKALADALLLVMTPISKGFFSEMGLEATSHGMQVLGGHGFIKEWGLEQELRDVRVSQMYEGTTGIQGLDLLGRKIMASKGAAIKPLVAMFDDFVTSNSDSAHAQKFSKYLQKWKALVELVSQQANTGGADEVNGAAVEFLMCAGYVTTAYFWSKAALVSEQKLSESSDTAFYTSKIHTAEFYYARIMPRMNGLIDIISNGASSLMALDIESFSFAENS